MSVTDPYRSRLERAIRDLHGAEPSYRGETYVVESFQGKPVWAGMVYAFDLRGHPSAGQCYGLVTRTDGGEVECSAILHTVPVQSPQTAVKAYLASRLKDAGRE